MYVCMYVQSPSPFSSPLRYHHAARVAEWAACLVRPPSLACSKLLTLMVIGKIRGVGVQGVSILESESVANTAAGLKVINR